MCHSEPIAGSELWRLAAWVLPCLIRWFARCWIPCRKGRRLPISSGTRSMWLCIGRLTLQNPPGAGQGPALAHQAQAHPEPAGNRGVANNGFTRQPRKGNGRALQRAARPCQSALTPGGAAPARRIQGMLCGTGGILQRLRRPRKVLCQAALYCRLHRPARGQGGAARRVSGGAGPGNGSAGFLAIRLLAPVQDRISDRAVKYAEAHTLDRLTLATLANALGYNATYLGRIFRNEQGQSFSRWLDGKRTEYAARLLRETERILSAIFRTGRLRRLQAVSEAFQTRLRTNPGEEYRRQTSAKIKDTPAAGSVRRCIYLNIGKKRHLSGNQPFTLPTLRPTTNSAAGRGEITTIAA